MIHPLAISVVIPTYQRCALVRRALESLARQTLAPEEFEVIVPIDGSDDGTREMVDSFRAPYRLASVWQPNQGRARARNAGVRLARGRLIVFMDDDMEPIPGFLRAHCAAHPDGSRRAVVGPVPIVADPAAPPVVQYRAAGMTAHLRRLAEPDYKLGFRDIYTGNLSLPHDVLREVGGFDETFTLYGHEDYELALRLVKAGVELSYSPDALAYQHYDKDFAGLARDSVARGQTAVLFARKHPDVATSPKLAGRQAGSPASQLARGFMLWVSGWVPRFPEWAIAGMTWLERRRPRRLYKYYDFALDYFFWLGARSAARETERPRTRRVRIGLILLVLFSVVSSLRLLARQLREFRQAAGPDEITSYEARFHPLENLAPPGAPVGYVTGPEPPGAEGGRLAFKRYVLTQYALLPAIVLPSARSALVVGNFDSTAQADSTALRGLEPVRDLGNGVILFRRTGE